MANLPELDQFDAGIYQIETEDPVLGGVDGIANKSAKALANRTLYLKNQQNGHAVAADPHQQYWNDLRGNAKIATAVAGLVNSSPAALDTLAELATALGNDSNFATTITNLLALKAPLANAALTGTPTAPTAAYGDATTKLATTAFVDAAVKGKADKIVRVTTTAAINLAAPGASIDGTAMVAGDVFLEKDNATLANRGVYVWNGAAVPATRDPAADTGAELSGGYIIRVKEGIVNADTNWQVTNDGAVTIGTTGLTFAQVGALPDATSAVKGKVLLAQSSGFTGTGSATDVPPVAAIIAGLLGAGGNSANDYITFPYRDKTDGSIKKVIIQFGSVSAASNVASAITFPIAFPVACLNVQVSYDGVSSDVPRANSKTTAGFSLGFDTWGAVHPTLTKYWFAIGI